MKFGPWGRNLTLSGVITSVLVGAHGTGIRRTGAKSTLRWKINLKGSNKSVVHEEEDPN